MNFFLKCHWNNSVHHKKKPTEKKWRKHYNIILDPSSYLLNIPLSNQTKNPNYHSLPEHTHARDFDVIGVVFYCPLVCSQDSTLELNPSMNPESACLQLDNWLIDSKMMGTSGSEPFKAFLSTHDTNHKPHQPQQVLQNLRLFIPW